MHTIDWPLDLTQTYVNVDLTDRTIVVDDDHQAVGQHSMRLSAEQARELAAVHRAMGEALNSAAAKLNDVPEVTGGQPSAPELA
jgi:hypothetical protein